MSNQYFGFNPPWWMANGHIETIYAALKRDVFLEWQTNTLELEDGDFLDYGFILGRTNHWILLCHGFEGSIDSGYVHSMAQHALKNGFSVLAWNYRGCSGRLNRLPFFYHSGATYDLDNIVRHLENTFPCISISICGYSLGGNLALKYAGELGLKKWYSGKVIQVAAVSPPVDLAGSSKTLESTAFRRALYSNRFLKSLRLKIHLKAKEKGYLYDFKSLDQVQTIWDFDECFTAPMYGYQSATDYYKANSSKAFLEFISLPTLIISAKNDVMLSESCFPSSAEVDNQLIKLNYTEKGGHVGFYDGFKTSIDKHIIDWFLKNQNILL